MPSADPKTGDDVIRDAVEADLPALLAMRNAEAQFRLYLERADGRDVRFLVCERGAQVVAFATLLLGQTTLAVKRLVPSFSDLHVAAAHRSQGIGSRFIARMEDLAREWGHARMYVGVDAVENVRALALYRRLGYVPMQSEPYRRVAAIWYDEEGQRIPKVYWRLDLVKELNPNIGGQDLRHASAPD
jgi:GNAT superfamily N-acetyltransferase